MKCLFAKKIIVDKKNLFIILYLFASFLFSDSTVNASEKPEIFVPLGHSDSIDSMALSPNGKYLITVSVFDKTMKLWDIELKKEVKTLVFNKDIDTIIFLKDGGNVIAGDKDGNLVFWDFNTLQIQRKIKISDSAITKLINLDSKNILISTRGRFVYCLDILKGTIRWKIRISKIDNLHRPFATMALSNDGEKIAVAIDESEDSKEQEGTTLKIYSTNNKKLFKKLPFISNYKATDIAFSSDGNYLIVVTRSSDLLKDDNKVFIFNINERKIIKIYHFPGCYSVNFSPDGKYFIVAGFYDVRLLNSSDFNEILRIDCSSPAALFSSDSRNIILADYKKGISIYDIYNKKEEIRIPKNTSIVLSSGYKNANTILSSSHIGVFEFNISDASGKNVFWQIDDSGDNIFLRAISEDGKYGAEDATINFVRVWDIDNKKVLYNFPEVENFVISELTFSRNGKYLVVASFSGEIISISLSNLAMKKFQGRHNNDISRLVLTSDNKFLFSSSDESIIKWDFLSGKILKKFKNNGSRLLGLSSDCKNIFLSDGILNTLTGEKREFFKGQREGLNLFGISSDGRLGILLDRGIKLLDLSSGKEVKTFEGHLGPISSVKFSPDSNRLISTSHDGTTRLWDIATGKEIAQFVSFTDGEWIVITPEGYYNASANGDKYLNVRIGNNVYSIENYREQFFRPDLVRLALAGESLKDYKTLAQVAQPPLVEIVDTPSQVQTDEVKITLRLTDMGGGIGDVRLYLNDTSILLDSARGVKIAPKPGEKTVYKTYTIRLLEGENIIKAVAFNSEGSMASNPALHKVVSLAKAIRKPSMYAVVIGINEYKNPKLDLKYAVADAKLFAESLKQVAQPLFEKVNITILTTKEETTKGHIKKTLEGLKALRPDDVFVFYVASHGTVDEGEYFLITSNVGSVSTHRLKEDALSQKELKELIANIPTTKKMIIIDTCNAGRLGEVLQVAMLTRGMSEDTAIKILSTAVGSTIISASTGLQESLEGYKGHGLFTYVLVEGMKGKADTDRDGFIRTLELANYVDSEVPALAEKIFKCAQYPTVQPIGQTFPVGRVR